MDDSSVEAASEEDLLERVSRAEAEAAKWKARFEKERAHREAVQKASDTVMQQIALQQQSLETAKTAVVAARASVPTVQKDAENIAAWLDAFQDDMQLQIFQDQTPVRQAGQVTNEKAVLFRLSLKSAGVRTVPFPGRAPMPVTFDVLRHLLKTWGLGTFEELPFVARAGISPQEEVDSLWTTERGPTNEVKFTEKKNCLTQFRVKKHNVLSSRSRHSSQLMQFVCVHLDVDLKAWQEVMLGLGVTHTLPFVCSNRYQVVSKGAGKRERE